MDGDEHQDIERINGQADSRFVAVGEGSTELIPRLWAERILGELRSTKPAVWRSLVGRASTAGASSGEG